MPTKGALVLVFAILGCSDESAAPHLDSADPSSAARQSAITLYGRDLCGTGTSVGNGCGSGASISFGSVQVAANDIITMTDTIYQVMVPMAAAIGQTEIVLTTVNGRITNALAFEILQ